MPEYNSKFAYYDKLHLTEMTTIFFFLLLFSVPVALAGLQVDFYRTTCPDAEATIHTVVRNHMSNDMSVTAALLRMHFHDCFVRGCDASILINATSSQQSEKTAGPNLTIRGFEVIDDAKAKLEALCPSTVSCADILAVATREAVALAGGPFYHLPTGRRDGLVSDPDDVDLPGPTFTVDMALQSFTDKGMTLQDMVVLLGAHTIGVAHCDFFRDRMFNFQGTGQPDSTMDSGFRSQLATVCGSANQPLSTDPTVFLDQNTSFLMDNSFYKQIIAHKGALEIDQELALDNSSAGIVDTLSNDNSGFLKQFGDAMIKLGSIEVLVGTAGETRKSCGAFN